MRKRWIMCLAALVAILVACAPSAHAAAEPMVNGAGWTTLPASFGDAAGDRVLFQLSARGSGEGARGALRVVHLDDAGGLYALGIGDVTCASIADGVAVATGVIREAWFRDFPGWDVTGTAAAITVADGGADDRLGFDFEFFGSTITPCGQQPPLFSVERGNFTIRQ